MNHQSYRATYRAAMDSANAELDGLFEEARLLRNRMEQIDSAIAALKPLLAPGSEKLEGHPAAESQDSSLDMNSTRQKIDSTLDLIFA